jgi:SPP1 gp7 family putative phage head morphogenesis protein
MATIVKSELFGKYTVNTFSDGTYGYMMPDGSFKNGYKSKDGAAKAGKKLAAKVAKAAKPQEDAQAELLEKQAQELQKKLQLTYADAIDGMAARVEVSFKQFEKDRAKWEADVAAGKKDAKAYNAWLKDQALHNDQLKALKRALAQDLTAVDKMAIAYANGMPAGVYAEGMNFATYEIEHGAKADTSFTLYDKNTVMELVAKEPGLLPQASFDKAKDLAWNRRHVNSAVTQAVLQGQTIPQLAASIAGIAAMDQRAAMRSARTAMTSAHSLGKLKGYERAAGMGIDVKKQWLAALDSRTRGSHRHLDGETVKLDAEFSNGLKYPGDPDGPGSEVYNCRCTMVPVIGDVPYDEVKRVSKLGDMTYEQWRNEHKV